MKSQYMKLKKIFEQITEYENKLEPLHRGEERSDFKNATKIYFTILK